MAGVKGRSGRTKTIAERQARIAASLKGGLARAAKSYLSQEPILHDESFTGPFLSIADYDKRLGPVLSWADVERREKAIAAILGNEAVATRNEVERGTLLTEAQVQERDDKWNAAMLAQAELVQRLLDTVPNVTADQRAAFLAAFRTWRTDLGKALGS